MSTCNQWDFESLGSWPTIYAKNLPGHYSSAHMIPMLGSRWLGQNLPSCTASVVVIILLCVLRYFIVLQLTLGHELKRLWPYTSISTSNLDHWIEFWDCLIHLHEQSWPLDRIWGLSHPVSNCIESRNLSFQVLESELKCKMYRKWMSEYFSFSLSKWTCRPSQLNLLNMNRSSHHNTCVLGVHFALWRLLSYE